MDYQEFLKLMPRRHELQELDANQSFALFRLLMLSSFADDEVTANERLALARTVNKIPLFGHSDQGSVFSQQEGFDILANLHDRYQNDFDALVEEIAEELGSHDARLAALQLMSRFVQTDGFVDNERAFCIKVGEAMGLDASEIDESIDQALSIVTTET